MSEVKLVISEADYSHVSEPDEYGRVSGEMGTQRALVGVGTDTREALKLIAKDHQAIVEANGSSTVEIPVEKISDEEFKLSGQPMTWKVITIPVNEVVNQEL